MRPSEASGIAIASHDLLAPSAGDHETARLAAVELYNVLDLELDEALDDCVRLAAHICRTPWAMISIVDATRQRAFRQSGSEVVDTPRELSFCTHALRETEIFEVPDASEDQRFAGNPSVSGSPYIRFYAGSPLVTQEGYALGTLCVMDTRRRRLSDDERVGLRSLAHHVIDHLELRLSAQQLKSQAELIHLAHDAIIVRDRHGKVALWNQGAEDTYGWTSTEILGEDFHERVQTEPLGREFPGMARDGTDTHEREVVQRTKAGERRVIRSRSVVKRDHNGVSGAVLEINSDVTAQKQSELEREGLVAALLEQNLRLQELDEMKDEFVASVSHEIRTPLACIRSYLEYLLDGDAGALTDEQRRCLGVVDRNSRRVLGLVTDLLFLAEHDGRRVHVEREQVDLAEIVFECVEGQSYIVRSRDQDLTFSRDGPTTVLGDSAKLAEVVDNLLSNAVKYTPPGESIRVKVAGKRGRVLLEVTDTGPGLTTADQHRVFERFCRGATPIDQTVRGIGLGLAVAKAIVELHHGSIGVRAKIGNGSTFWVLLPSDSRASPAGRSDETSEDAG